MGFGNDLFSAILDGVKEGVAQGFRESRIEEMMEIKGMIDSLILNFTAILVQKVKPRKPVSFLGYMSDLVRLTGMIGNTEVYDAVEGINGNIVQVLERETLYEYNSNIQHLFDVIKNYYSDYSLEIVDLNEFFVKQSELVNGLLFMDWSNRKKYKYSKAIVIEINRILTGVSSDLETMLSLV